jgi:hypothetical protein
VALTPLAILFSVLGAFLLETFVDKPGSMPMSTLFPGVAHAAMPVTAACFVNGALAAVIALAGGERPRWLPVLGLATTVSIIGLLVYLRG